ncbi:MAG: ABC transporter substrate-binding protein [Candidatus Bathyarchaeota archaeon]|nr:ABC transporter substrate-binding protein [Candidatus Bathyarchaeota archaeon]
MKKITIAILAVVLIVIIAGSTYGVYTLNQGASDNATPEGNVLTIVDPNGDTVKISQPVKTVVCLDAVATEIVCALGCQSRIIGIDTSSDFPPSITAVPNVGESYSPSVEKILEMQPDLVLGGAPINYFNNQTSKQIEDAGIPVFICEAINPSLDSTESMVDETCALVTQLGQILQVEDNATRLVDYMQGYENLVDERLANLADSEKPTVYYEWYTDWQTSLVPSIPQAGGINIAENATEYAPILSPEFVTQANPDVIIRMISSTKYELADFTAQQNQLTGRTALKATSAVKEGHVYICDYAITGGIEMVVGYVQWAKWLHPDLFSDVNPTAIHQELLAEFFPGVTLQGVYAYP